MVEAASPRVHRPAPRRRAVPVFLTRLSHDGEGPALRRCL